LSYTHYVHFVDDIPNHGPAETGGNETGISHRNLIDKMFDANRQNADRDLIYANILAHEICWLGLLGEHDDTTAETCSLPSNTASTSALLELTEEEVDEIMDAMDAEEPDETGTNTVATPE
jgi:hypothetical protein